MNSKENKKFALIVAGGSGSRMKSQVPKQFLEMAGIPVLMHTIKVFEKFDQEIEFVVVLPENQVDYWKQLCKKHDFRIEHKIAFGGETRFHSVKNGLKQISEKGIVFIHDAVRPLVSNQTLLNCLETAIDKGNALPVIPVYESVREVSESKNRVADRSKLFLVQTPQTFQVQLIKDAYSKSNPESFTDDASVLESCGHQIHLVEGNRENIKITTPFDLVIAKNLKNIKFD